MSKSLKLMMVAFCTLFMAGQANAVQYLDDAHSGIHMLNDNQHVFTFIPRDIKGIQGNAKNAIHLCDEHGNEIYKRNSNLKSRSDGGRGVVSAGTCATYYSQSTNTSWVISFAQNLGTAARAQKIFELKNNQMILWAKFNPQIMQTYTQVLVHRNLPA